jgi:hypothetical protein
MLSSCRLPMCRVLIFAALSCELRYGFDVRGVSQGDANGIHGASCVRHELDGWRRSRLKRGSSRIKDWERDIAGKLDGSEFKKLRYFRNLRQQSARCQLNRGTNRAVIACVSWSRSWEFVCLNSRAGDRRIVRTVRDHKMYVRVRQRQLQR